MRLGSARAIFSCIAALAVAAAVARAEAPKDALQVITDATDALANNDADRFLGLIDPKMPGFESLYAEVHYMVAAEDEIESDIEIVTEKQSGAAWELELDWVLRFNMDPPKRAIIKCRLEKQNGKWKIAALTPVEFFKV